MPALCIKKAVPVRDQARTTCLLSTHITSDMLFPSRGEERPILFIYPRKYKLQRGHHPKGLLTFSSISCHSLNIQGSRLCVASMMSKGVAAAMACLATATAFSPVHINILRSSRRLHTAAVQRGDGRAVSLGAQCSLETTKSRREILLLTSSLLAANVAGIAIAFKIRWDCV